MLVLHSPLDMHVHLRQGDELQRVAPVTARTFAGAAIMPNLQPAVESLACLLAYKKQILQAVEPAPFQPYMTLFFRPYTRDELVAARKHILGVKLYPAGMTVNTDGGVMDLRCVHDTLELMEDLDIPLLVHGEAPGFILDRESRFLPYLSQWAQSFPRLRIVLEHISTRSAVELLDHLPKLSASITLHHLLLTLDDVLGDCMKPHLFCSPIPKYPEDRAALRQALLEHPKVFFGSDSAPHPLRDKESASVRGGVFSAPVVLPALATLLEKMGRLDRLQHFVSNNAQNVYGITPPKVRVSLERESWTVPEKVDGVVPFLAGQTLPWRVVEDARLVAS